MSKSQTSLFERLTRHWPILGLAVAGMLIINGLMGRTRPLAQAASDHNQPKALQLRAIEDIRVGDRVITDRPAATLHPSEYRPSTTEVNSYATDWRLVRLLAEEAWDDGTIDDINIVTLQPLFWIKENGINEGVTTSIPLDLAEMGLPEQLRAKVLAVEPCPLIASGSGRVVLTTVNHLSRAIRELTLRSSNGRTTTIQTTALHKFYSNTRGKWMSAMELSVGESLVGFGDPITVAGNIPIEGTQRVYNLTVEGDHVYRVSTLAVLVHNNQCGDYHMPGDLPDGRVVVRGGTAPPPTGTVFSGAQGADIVEAGAGVPHGTISPTTAGGIRGAGGTVIPAPEPAFPGGPINGGHVNIELPPNTNPGTIFGPPMPNPVPRPQRIPGRPR